MPSVDIQLIEALVKARDHLLMTLRIFQKNANKIQLSCPSQDPDLIEPIDALSNALDEMISLSESRLPLSQMDAERLDDELDEGGWHKFERKFVHDLRNPLGVALGYSEILDETLEDFQMEPEFKNALWIDPLRSLIESFSNQLHHFNKSLDNIFPQHVRSDSTRSTTLIPINDSPRPERTPLPTLASSKPTHQNPINDLRGEVQNVHSSISRVLIVDDSQSNRDLLCSMLKREGYLGEAASSAYEALQRLEESEYDLILLDLMMPEVTGYELLEQLKSSPRWRRLPILMISGDNEIEIAIRCIELGAEDFLQKPFNRVLLKARIGACVEKKHLMDEMEAQNQRFKSLLHRILPVPVVKRLDEGEELIADRFNSTTILFSDLVGFTRMSAQLSASEVINTLDEIFSAFDEIAEHFGIEKIKTIGDAYMAAGGLPIARLDHADATVKMGIEMIKVLEKICLRLQLPLQMRVGIHSGPVAAGIIGRNRFLYDVWGDTVNIASRLEASGQPSAVHLSSNTQILLKDTYDLKSTGGVNLKGKGVTESYLIYPFPV